MHTKSRWLSSGLAGAFALAFAFVAEAATYYVSKSGTNGGGTSWETAMTTIQAAVELCSDGGDDTVIVDDGDYADIGATLSITVDGFSFSIPTVVNIDRPLTLKSRNGKGKTFITGKYGDGTAQDGSAYTFPETGKGAVRCVYAGKTATISGFTIRNGSTVRARTGVNNDVDIGGGVVAGGGTTYLVDCDVLDCRAGCGAALSRDVRPIRCRIAGNFAKDDNQVAYRNRFAFNCLFENNGNNTASSFIFTKVQPNKIVNCTFVNNHVTWIGNVNGGQTFAAYNCAFLDVIANGSSGAYDFANCVQTVSGGKVATGVGCVVGVSKFQYFSPAEGDWSAVTGGALVGKGSTAYLTTALTGVPSADYLTTDFTGTNPRKTGSKVAVGCFEPTMEKTLVAAVEANAPAEVADGSRSASNDSTAVGRWFGVGKAGQVRVRYAGEGDVFGYTVANDGANAYSSNRFPDNGADGGFWLTPTPGGVTTVSAMPATDEKWVDAAADGAEADGSEAKPFATIPAAMAAVKAKGIIRVKPGLYATGTDKGSDHVTGGDASACRVSLWKAVAVRSTEGAAKTVLKGGGDVVTIVRPSNHSLLAHVQGFTLTGGANDPARDPAQGETGGAFYAQVSGETSRGYSEYTHVTDCVISNNVCSTRVVEGGWLERCYLCDNFTTKANMDTGTGGKRGTHAYGSILSGCVVTYSPQYFLKGGYPTVCTAACQNDTLMNCTLNIPTKDAGNNVYRTFNTPNGCTVAYNDATVGGQFDSKASTTIAAGIVSSPGADAGSWKKAFDEGTFFNDAANGDYRPIAGCPGSLAGAVVADKYVRYETGDFDGNALAYQPNGASIPGAFQSGVKVLVATCEPGHGTISPSGNLHLDDGETVTFTATVKDDAHRLLGWLVDGEPVMLPSPTYAYTVDYAKPTLSISPIFSTDLYVNAAMPDNSGDGSSPMTAKRTLAAIAALAATGDTIHATPGDYNEGTMTQTAKIAVSAEASPSRVVLPAGVALVSDMGPDMTFITGSGAKGPSGVRCVAAFAGATVRGFTLRDGATFDTTGIDRDNNLGGCALAPFATSRAETAFFENCVFIDGKARTGGCVAGGYLHKCKVVNGNGGAGASLTFHSLLDHSIAVGNGNTGVRNHHGVLSSVVINLGSGNTYYDLSAANDSAVCENSILVCQNKDLNVGSPVHKNVRNCLWNVGQGVASIDDATSRNVVTCAVDLATLDTALASLGLDADFCPLRDSPVVDAGDTALLTKLVDSLRDFAGGPRVSNAAVDIGAREHDWRVDYAAVLLNRPRRFAVTAADPLTRIAEGGDAVELPAGELVAVWQGGTGYLTAPIEVTGNGTLRILRDGRFLREVVAADGVVNLKIESAAATELTFAYAPGAAEPGMATLHAFSSVSGMMLLVR